MVQLAAGDIKTREVLDWKGVHLFHYQGSSCSQKTRIVLNLKGIDWESHVMDLAGNQNFDSWYLGINPRGLVPTLVIDGAVHIESNDIITLLDERFPEPKLIPKGRESEMADLLRHEDDLHLDLRTLSFRFVFARPGPPKSAEALEKYRSGGSGTVLGQPDRNKGVEIDFWERVAREGITDAAARKSALKFRAAFAELEERLADNAYLLGDTISVLDIAWFIFVNRLILAGYPVERLHRRLYSWFQALLDRPAFAKEVQMPPEAREAIAANHKAQEQAGTTLSDVAGF